MLSAIKHVVFADDDPNLLQGLRRSLYGLKNEWRMSFACGGQQVIQILNTEHVDALITDMRMPEVDGAQVVQHAMKVQPHCIRFILSGQADRALTFRTIGYTHQFLAKPCQTDVLVHKLKAIFSLQDQIDDPQLSTRITGFEALPICDDSRRRVFKALTNQWPQGRIAPLIARDPGMSCLILQLVNSGYFGIGEPVSCPIKAFNRLDLAIVRDLCEQNRLFMSPTLPHASPHYTRLVTQARKRALAFRRIARHAQLPKAYWSVAYQMGMFARVGDLLTTAMACDPFPPAHIRHLMGISLWALLGIPHDHDQTCREEILRLIGIHSPPMIVYSEMSEVAA